MTFKKRLLICVVRGRLGPVDAVLVTDLNHPQAVYDDLLTVLPAERVLPLALLRIVPAGDQAPGAAALDKAG